MQVEVAPNGEIVIPKEVAEAAGFAPGCAVDVAIDTGALTLEAEPVSMRLEWKDGLPILVPGKPVPPLTNEDVAAILEEVRFERVRSDR